MLIVRVDLEGQQAYGVNMSANESKVHGPPTGKVSEPMGWLATLPFKHSPNTAAQAKAWTLASLPRLTKPPPAGLPDDKSNDYQQLNTIADYKYRCSVGIVVRVAEGWETWGVSCHINPALHFGTS